MSSEEHNHILVVDDSEGTRFAVCRMLQAAGFRVTEAGTGEEALRLAKEMPDLVLLDVRLPDLSGFDVCRTIKSDPCTAVIPVLHMSASFVRAEDQAYGLEGGADGYLTEPVDRVVLIATVRALLRARRAEARAREAMRVAESANRAKDRFLAALSHELRTPLTPALMAVCAMATNDALPADVRDDLSVVRRNLELEVALIDDLLDLARAVNGKLRLNQQRVSAHEVLRHVLSICDSDIRVKGLDVRCELTASSDQVSADPARVRQVFWNLLKNAVKFTPPGGSIVLRTECDGEAVRVRIEDSGVGMPPEVLPRIFDAFEQGGNPERPSGGLGLGLTIARAIVEQHGGSITAESGGIGLGSAFTVRLPTIYHISSRSVSAEPAPGCIPPMRPLSILLVEDHVDTAQLLGNLLTLSGHSVRTAGTAASALEYAATEKFDVVLSDLGLPDASGHDLMRQLKQMYGLTGVALSGYGMEDDLHRSEDAGFAEHIIKPVNLARLEAVLQQVTSRQPTR